MQTSELGVTEHVEGDPCKFALWVGRTPTSDNKIVLKVRSPEAGTCCVARLPWQCVLPPLLKQAGFISVYVFLLFPFDDNHEKNSVKSVRCPGDEIT